ncbi:subtilisin-like protease SBT5.3 [Carex littledalei]|uniref:Subtilisin-like protease SBT5.3 n=1 Tax=Carex littledalei TaxID=544730 RepID=A0A833QK99_9POAL|nr:subtilisin-like protease SBT5.3 [Carex littledalei]
MPWYILRNCRLAIDLSREAVVFRHNEGKMLKDKKIQVYEMVRCKSRKYCKIQERDEAENVIKLTLLLRSNSRSFKDEVSMINVFRKECAKVKACRLKVTRPDNLTFCDQVKMMSETDILALPHGAQLTNLFFMDKNSSVMEFFPKGWKDLAGPGQFVYQWISAYSGMRHVGTWHDPKGDKFVEIKGENEEKKQIYVVYMGSASPDSSKDFLRESHLKLLGSVLKRGEKAENILVRNYKYGFSGFAARLSEAEALALKRKPGVVSVFVDPVYKPHTTRSWDFLQQNYALIDSRPNSDSTPATADTIIGLLDTGIWPESESFSDNGFGAVPSRWKGICMKGSNFTSSNCNKKLIGARYYATDEAPFAPTVQSNVNSARDEQGHGTHTASTAAGNSITGASYYGLASGTAKGGSTGSRIAMYRVCSSAGCPGSQILAGFDDAVADGVDLLSVSLGASAFFRPDFSEDPIAIGAFHAVAKGITVVCSAGNDGPTASSVVNAAPWILTVAATTIDRYFESDILLGGNRSAIKGEAINFSMLNKSPNYPLIDGGSAKSNSSDVTSASYCEPGTLDGSKTKGKIVVCKHSQSDTSKTIIFQALKDLGSIGTIFANDMETYVASSYNTFPVSDITAQAANDVFSYINSTKNPVATILPTITVTKFKPAPVIAYFSSRGPSARTRNLLKPDIAAPGVNILASWIPTSTGVPNGQKPSQFNLVSGTSMACPHVAGVAATIKAWNPTWSPFAIRSAIMTTATQANSDKAPLMTISGSAATPYDIGSGEVVPTAALQPGLVYDLTTRDLLLFLCNYGYNSSKISLISNNTNGFSCPSNSSINLISDLNYPSIAVSALKQNEVRTVNRVVTNVGAQDDTVYTASVNSPSGLDVRVVPNKLKFSKSYKSLGFQVLFSVKDSSLQGDLFGSITWSDGTHTVRSPFAVTTAG